MYVERILNAPKEELITAKEVAKRLRLSVRTVRAYARSGKIPSVKINRRDIRFHWPTVVSRMAGN